MTRLHSYKVLSEVYFKQRHAHLVLKELDVSSEEQAFISALVYTTLQNSIFLDYQYEDLVDKKLPKEVALIIKMGCAQYFKMDGVPVYALVNESVSLTKKIGKGRYAGVVNAVLKKIVDRNERPIEGNALQMASIQLSMPLWIMNLLAKQYDTQFALDYAAYCAAIKPSYIRVNTLKPMPESYQELFDSLHEKEESGLIAKSAFFKSPILQEGYALIQDINSQKVVQQMQLEEHLSVLDCCCGPGTKTSQIAALMHNTGSIVGVELHESRAQSTKDLMDRSNVNNTHIVTSDVLKYETDATFDRILLDAPCSGLGVLSHKHDLRYHILPSDLDDLVFLQSEMLDHVVPMLEEKGILTYATCTLNRKENDRQIAQFLERHPEFECIHEETLNPMETLGDGFYIAHLKRKC